MFKDKQLHSALAQLTDKFLVFLKSYNLDAEAVSGNLGQLNDKATVALEKLEKIHRTIYDNCDRGIAHSNQIAEVYTLVKGLALFQRQVEWHEDNTKQLEAERDLIQADNLKLQQRIEELTDYAAQCDVAIHGQSLELVQLRDALKDANEQAIKATFTPTVQPVHQQPIVVNNQFNMQELASELSKYLNPNPVDNSRLQPTTKQQFEPFADPAPLPTHEDSGKAFFQSSGSASGSNGLHMPKAVEVVVDTVVPGNSFVPSASYIPSPAQEEPDEIVQEQHLFTDPAVAHRLQQPTGPVLLPSQRQLALQAAELGEVGLIR